MNNYNMTLPNYSIGEQAYQDIPRFCRKWGSRAVMIGGKTAMEKAADRIAEAAQGITLTGRLWYGGEASYENVAALQAREEVQQADMIFAVGGGKALDTCKTLADKLGKPVFTFPTIASNCACCTCVAIMYTPEGTFIEPYFFDNAPVHAFINTQLLAEAPEQFLWAGMGDTYAKFYEATISARGEQPEHFKALGLAMASMCTEPIFRFGEAAFADNKTHQPSEAFREVVLAICVSTGLVSIMLTKDHTPDYNSGLAHACFYTWTSIGIEEHHLHGEIVAFGVLVCLLYDGQKAEYARVRDFNARVGLPVRLADLDLTLADTMTQQIAGMSDVRHYPYKVDPERLQEVFAEIERGESVSRGACAAFPFVTAAAVVPLYL